MLFVECSWTINFYFENNWAFKESFISLVSHLPPGLIAKSEIIQAWKINVSSESTLILSVPLGIHD